MGFATGTRTTTADIEHACQQRIRLIVKRLYLAEIDPDDAARQLIDLIGKAVNRLARHRDLAGVENAE